MKKNRLTYQPGVLKSLIMGLLLAVGMAVHAQPSLEHTYPVSVSVCNLEKSGIKYFSMDVTAQQCQIFNIDHTLHKFVSLTVPADYYLYNIQHVSQHLFNQDDLIEFVYIYSKYNATETSYYYSYETVVINESGTVIETIPGAGHTEIKVAEDSSRKFLVYVYDFFQIPATTQTMVYSLPDPPDPPDPPVQTTKSGGIRNQHRLGNPWPNPSGGIVNIPVHLPPDVESGELVLYNIYGQEVMRKYVEGDEELLILPGGVLIPGTYLYKLQHRKGESQGKKITIQ
ncbi:T9SS type A sorting domain-containing protein [Bacteroidota bacterium]